MDKSESKTTEFESKSSEVTINLDSLRNEINELTSRILKLRDKLHSSIDRWPILPPHNEDVFRFFKRMEAQDWPAGEMDYTSARDEYEKLSPKRKKLFKYVSAFFSPADGGIVENDVLRFLFLAETAEDMAFIIQKTRNECAHNETYNLINQTVFSKEELKEIKQLIENSKGIKFKFKFIEKYIMGNYDIATRYAAASIMEGFFLVELFLPLFSFRALGVMENVIFINEQISKDETLHRDYFIYKYDKSKKCSNDVIEKMAEEALEASYAMIDEMFIDGAIDDLNSTDVKEYARCILGDIISLLGHSNPYSNSKNKYEHYTNGATLIQKSNIHELRSGNYRIFNVDKLMDKYKNLQTAKKVDAVSNSEDIDV